MNNDRFVVILSPKWNKNITEEALRKFLEDNWGEDSFHLVTVPEDKSYTLSAMQCISEFENLKTISLEEIK